MLFSLWLLASLAGFISLHMYLSGWPNDLPEWLLFILAPLALGSGLALLTSSLGNPDVFVDIVFNATVPLSIVCIGAAMVALIVFYREVNQALARIDKRIFD